MTNQIPPKILIIGFSCRAAAQSACEEGFEVSVVDRCGDRDTRSLACEFAFAPDSGSADDWIRILSPLAKSCDDYLLAGGTEHDDSLFAAIGAINFRSSNAPSQSHRSIGTMRSFDNWERWGSIAKTPIPFSIKLEHGTPYDWPKLARNRRPLLLKKQKSSGGLGVSMINQDMLAETTPFSEGDILQEHIDGDSFGISFLSSTHGSVAIGCCKSLKNPCFAASQKGECPKEQDATSPPPNLAGPTSVSHPWGPFVYAGSEGPIALTRREWETLDSFGLCVSRASGWLGLWQSDFIRDTTGNWHLLEINPRWTSSMELLSKSCAKTLISSHYRAIQDRFSSTEWNDFCKQTTLNRSGSDRFLRKRILYAPSDYLLNAQHAEDWWARRWANAQQAPCSVYYGDIPNELGPIPFGFPICSVIEVENLSRLQQ